MGILAPGGASIKLGTRGSALALWQAEHVAARLRAYGCEVAMEIIKTTGDLDQSRAFGAMGGKGLFVKEIEEALLARRIDLAVHSLKDLPTDLPEGLQLGAVMERETPFDGLVSRDGRGLGDLAPGATLATGSLRRGAQALALRPDLKIVPLRGNVPTRVQKIKDGGADATLMAAAGLKRLGLAENLAQTFTAEEITPPMGQGALGIETRGGELPELLAALEHLATRRAADAERAFIARIGGGCKTPAGVLAAPTALGWKITGMIASEDGKSLLRRSAQAKADDDLAAAARALAESMLADADAAILATLHPKSG